MKPKEIAKALGTTTHFKVKRFSFPLDCLVSSGGRLTNPCWELKRLVPFNHETWDNLRAEAQKQKVTPAQLAAMIIEDWFR